ncbi:hypothetical protein KKF84_01530 [Myxococcota bacterium]|nr:hypothetical protein [Myxococcota bacterium]
MRSFLWVGFVVVSQLACACGTGSKGGGETPERTRGGASDPMDVKPQVPQKAPTVKSCTTYEGYLEIDPVRYGKGVQGVTVYTKEGRGVGITLWYGKEHMQYIGKRVVICGGMAYTSSDPRAQRARYFKVESIKLAPGEKPYDSVPTEVPHPRVITSGAEMAALPGGWGVAVGKATYAWEDKGKSSDGPTRTVAKVTLTLSDGTTISKHLWQMVSADSTEYRSGSIGTMLFRYSRSRKEASAFKYCTGRYPWCGMKRRPFKALLNRFIKGGYTVYEKKVDVGYLAIWGNRYAFTASKNLPSGALKKRLPFVRKPKGTMKLVYAKGVSPEAEMKSLTRDRVVARITFNGRDAFEIRVGNKGGRLFFHSTVSELQYWSVEKSLWIPPPTTKSPKKL